MSAEWAVTICLNNTILIKDGARIVTTDHSWVCSEEEERCGLS